MIINGCLKPILFLKIVIGRSQSFSHTRTHMQGLERCSQHSHGSQEPSLTPVPEALQAYILYTYVQVNTHTHKIKANLCGTYYYRVKTDLKLP